MFKLLKFLKYLIPLIFITTSVFAARIETEEIKFMGAVSHSNTLKVLEPTLTNEAASKQYVDTLKAPKYVTSELSTTLDSEQVLSPLDFNVNNNSVYLQSRYENNIMQLFWDQMAMGGMINYGMVDGFADRFTNQTFIYQSRCSGQTYDAANHLYKNYSSAGSSYASYFDSAADRWMSTNAPGIRIIDNQTNKFTLLAWVNFDGTAPGTYSQSTLLCKQETPQMEWFWEYYIVGDGSQWWRFEIGGGNYLRNIGQFTLTNDSAWHMITLVKSGDNLYNMWFDANQGTNSAANANIVHAAVAQPLLIGCILDTTYQRAWSGSMDEVCIYDRALSGTEISNKYNSGSGVYGTDTSGLVVRYHFNEGTGTNMAGDATALYAYNTTDAGTAPTWSNGVVCSPLATTNNMWLSSTNYTGLSVPTAARIQLDVIKNDATFNLATELQAWVSRDSGTTSNAVTLTVDKINGTHTFLSGVVDLSSQPSGSNTTISIHATNKAFSVDTWGVNQN